MDKEKMLEWICFQDGGIPSKTMWIALMFPQNCNSNYSDNHPYDCEDFSHCYNLYKFAKLTLNDLRTVANKLPYWAPIIDSWSELTDNYEKAEYEKVDAILHNIHDEIMRLKGYIKRSEFCWEKAK